MKQEYKDDIKKNCKKNAESMVDKLFNNNLFNPKLKREDLRVVEKILVLDTYGKIISQIELEELLNSIEVRKMKKSILKKIKELENILIEIKDMGYDVTFNTIASLYEQINNPRCTCGPTDGCNLCTKETN